MMQMLAFNFLLEMTAVDLCTQIAATSAFARSRMGCTSTQLVREFRRLDCELRKTKNLPQASKKQKEPTERST
jgi:hypothetical protein